MTGVRDNVYFYKIAPPAVSSPGTGIHFPNSVGAFYSAFPYHIGLEVDPGQYKLLGLGPYSLCARPRKFALPLVVG